MKLKLLFISIFVLTLLGCGIKGGMNADQATSDPNEPFSSNEIEFDRLKEWVKDKKIVAIGESTHGLGEFYSLKSDLVRYFHQELGFEVLAIEAGFGDVNLAWANAENLGALELRDKTLFGNFKCKEIEPLFSYIKEQSTGEKPLLYTGFDTQASTNYYENYLDSICRQLKLEIDIDQEFSAYRKMYQASNEPDSANFTTYKISYYAALDKIKDAIVDNRSTLENTLGYSERELDIVLRNLEVQRKAVDYSYAHKFNPEYMPMGMILRDEFMADNLTWIMETLYPNKKILIWAHNGHVQKGKSNNMNTKWMGQILKDTYGDNYFSIGLFAYEGKAYQHWTGQAVEFENADSVSIELKMKKEGFQYTFQKFGNTNPEHWTNQEVTAFEPESNGNIRFIPADRFDAGINISRGDIPTFD